MAEQHGYGLYLKTWIGLLVLTMVMIGAEMMDMPRVVTVLVLGAFMLIKGGIIAANFMHLKYEKRSLFWTVALAMLVTGAVLFALIAVDGARLHEIGIR